MIPANERKAVLAVFNDPEYETWEEADAADRIIEALNEAREATKRFVVVANLKWPDHEMYHMYAAGPFNTKLQAEKCGEGFVNDPATGRGNGRWKAVPILSGTGKAASRTAWSEVAPNLKEPCCSLHHGMIKDDMDKWTWYKAEPNAQHWRKGGW